MHNCQVNCASFFWIHKCCVGQWIANTATQITANTCKRDSKHSFCKSYAPPMAVVPAPTDTKRNYRSHRLLQVRERPKPRNATSFSKYNHEYDAWQLPSPTTSSEWILDAMSTYTSVSEYNNECDICWLHHSPPRQIQPGIPAARVKYSASIPADQLTSGVSNTTLSLLILASNAVPVYKLTNSPPVPKCYVPIKVLVLYPKSYIFFCFVFFAKRFNQAECTCIMRSAEHCNTRQTKSYTANSQ